MDMDSFQNLFPIVLLIIWVVVKAMAGRKKTPTHRDCSGGRAEETPFPMPCKEPQSAQPIPQSGGQLYDSMRKALEEYFGEPPAEPLQPEQAPAPAAPLPPPFPTNELPSAMEAESDSLEGPSLEEEEEEAEILIKQAPAVIVSYTPAAATPAASPLLSEQPAESAQVSRESRRQVRLGDVDLSDAFVWSEILGPPVAMRD